MREYEYERVGPGAYSLGVEKIQATNAGKQKLMGKAVASAFSTTEARNLDTRTTAQKENPGPNHYSSPKSNFMF